MQSLLGEGFSEPLESGRRGLGILVADAEPSVRASLRACLEHLGFRVWSVANGQEAIDLYRCRGDQIDVILLDVDLRDLNGPRTLAQLRRINPAVKGCLLNGDVRRRLGEMAGDFPVYVKPFDATRFAGRLRDLAGSGTAPAAATSSTA